MTPLLRKYRLITLFLFALLAGTIWRIEVEQAGWHGLIWITYFHYAIPAALFLFLIWANLSIQIELIRRIALNLIAISIAFIAVITLDLSFGRMFMSGPSALFYSPAKDPLRFLIFGDVILSGILPLIIALIARMFGIVCRPVFVVLSITSLIISPYFGIFLLDLFNEKGPSDYIHTIKSGYLLALWFFSIGLVFIRHKHSTKKQRKLINPELIDSPD